MAKYDYRGVVHCHSDYSDGKGTYKEIADAANDAGLDFLLMSDHDTLKPADDGEEGYKGSTLVVVGTEITPAGGNHYLAFGEKGFKGVNKLHSKTPQEIIADVEKNGWFGFIAHPDRGPSKRFQTGDLRWTAWDATGFTGLGVWHLFTDWAAQAERDDFNAQAFHEVASWLAGPRPETLQRWDQLCQTRKVIGIGEVDNHAEEHEFQGEKYRVFPYEVAFKTITNHVQLDSALSRDPKEAKTQVLKALRYGRFYVALDALEDPTEFDFEIDDGETSASMGDEYQLHEVADLIVTVPSTGLISVVQNGEVIHEAEGDEMVLEITDPGVYRVEVLHNNMTWIVSNPIWVKADAEQPSID